MSDDVSSLVTFLTALAAISINILDKVSDKKTLHKIANILVFATLVRVRFARARARAAKHIDGYKFSTPLPVKKVMTYKFLNGLDSYPDHVYHTVAREIIIDCRNRDWAALVIDLSDCKPLSMPEKVIQLIKLISNAFDSERLIIFEPRFGIKGRKNITYKNIVFVNHGDSLADTELRRIVNTEGSPIVTRGENDRKRK